MINWKQSKWSLIARKGGRNERARVVAISAQRWSERTRKGGRLSAQYARICILLLIGIVIGVFLPMFFRRESGATIILKNHTDKVVQSVEIETTNGIRLVKDIQPTTEKEAKIFPQGEASYKMVITFDDNTNIKTDECYIETGYRIIETINDDGIETEFDLKY